MDCTLNPEKKQTDNSKPLLELETTPYSFKESYVADFGGKSLIRLVMTLILCGLSLKFRIF